MGVIFLPKYSSPAYPDHWEVKDVVERTHILFHKANYVDEIEGCLAVVSDIEDKNKDDNDPGIMPSRRWRGVNSGKAWERFKKVMPDEFELVIRY